MRNSHGQQNAGIVDVGRIAEVADAGCVGLVDAFLAVIADQKVFIPSACCQPRYYGLRMPLRRKNQGVEAQSAGINDARWQRGLTA